MFQVNKSNLFIPLAGPLDSEGRVVSLPALDIHSFKEVKCKTEGIPDVVCSKKHASWDDINTDTGEEYPVSCMQVDNSTSCIYIDSSVSSSSNSISLSDTLHLVRKLTSIYDNQESPNLIGGNLINTAMNYELPESSTIYQESPHEGEISLIVPTLSTTDSDTVEGVVKEKEEDDNSVSTSSSISPSHGKLGVPSKAAAILGAREIFTSPSHAAYRRLVDFTHRPTCDVSLLTTTDSSTIPSPIHVGFFCCCCCPCCGFLLLL